MVHVNCGVNIQSADISKCTANDIIFQDCIGLPGIYDTLIDEKARFQIFQIFQIFQYRVSTNAEHGLQLN